MAVHNFDLYLIQSATQRAKDYAIDTVKRVQQHLVDDAHKDRRRASHYCKWCWYRASVSLAGQAISSFNCWRCDTESYHSNTATPRLCQDCGKQTGLCVACCGDIDGKRRKEVP